MDKPNPHVHRFLISTTSRFTGVYESPTLQLDHCWPNSESPNMVQQGLRENSLSRNFLVLSAYIEMPAQKTIAMPNYNSLADRICTALSVLFGKRFDNHGSIMSHQLYFVPDIGAISPMTYFNSPPYNHESRRDLDIPLQLAKFAVIAPLFTDESLEEKFKRLFFTAGRFYLRSLQMFEQEPEFAYLDLITCGEILANFYSYKLEDILDESTKKRFEQIRSEMREGEKVVRHLQERMRQIKRAYTLTLTRLLNDRFFETSECAQPFGCLQKNDIERRIKAAYDLRSQYVHNGVDFGRWINTPHGVWNEVQLGIPIVDDKDYKRALAFAPTFFGMERLMRYCLLRFVHLNGVPIHSALNDGECDSSTIESKDISKEDSVGRARSKLYVKKTGKVYHNADCRYIVGHDVKLITLEAARKSYRGCKQCNPLQ